MSMLQTRYANTQLTPLHIDSIEPGKIYASKYEDGCWYRFVVCFSFCCGFISFNCFVSRTSVIKVIHSGSISVFYCDFGYYANLTLQQLVPLGVEFTELPFQAIKAKLSGNIDTCRFDCICIKSVIEEFREFRFKSMQLKNY